MEEEVLCTVCELQIIIVDPPVGDRLRRGWGSREGSRIDHQLSKIDMRHYVSSRKRSALYNGLGYLLDLLDINGTKRPFYRPRIVPSDVEKRQITSRCQ